MFFLTKKGLHRLAAPYITDGPQLHMALGNLSMHLPVGACAY